MKVVLPVSLFDSAGPDPFDLDALLHVVRRREHVLVLDPPWSEEESTLRSWMARRERRYAEMWRLVLEEGADADANGVRLSVRVVAGSPSDWPKRELTLHDAIRLLDEPLNLFLEDEGSDFQFLLRIATPRRRSVLKEAVATSRARPRHGGGNTRMASHLERLKRDRRSVDQAVVERAWIETCRLWVLFDRDADEADATRPHRNADKLTKACERLGVPFHCTSRRSIENYLPFTALERWAVQKTGNELNARRKKVKAFASDGFGAERRACYAMKEGLQKDRREDRLPPPFSGMAPALEQPLERGFGSDIARFFADSSLPDRPFHEVFDQDPVAHELREAIFTSLFRSL